DLVEHDDRDQHHRAFEYPGAVPVAGVLTGPEPGDLMWPVRQPGHDGPHVVDHERDRGGGQVVRPAPPRPVRPLRDSTVAGSRAGGERAHRLPPAAGSCAFSSLDRMNRRLWWNG